MINKNYRESAIEVYGEACEICGYRASVEVHHINYQEQQQTEDLLRNAKRHNLEYEFKRLLAEAKESGFVEFANNQLAKDDDTKNLAVLCGNCHGFIHRMDVGMKLTKALKPRK